MVFKAISLWFRQSHCWEVQIHQWRQAFGVAEQFRRHTLLLWPALTDLSLGPKVPLWEAGRRTQSGEGNELKILGCTGIGSWYPSIPDPGDHTYQLRSFPCAVGFYSSAQPLHTPTFCSAFNFGFIPGCHIFTLSWLLAVLPCDPWDYNVVNIII